LPKVHRTFILFLDKNMIKNAFLGML